MAVKMVLCILNVNVRLERKYTDVYVTVSLPIRNLDSLTKENLSTIGSSLLDIIN